MLEHLAHLVIRAKLAGINPNALPHQEGIVAHLLFRLDLQPLKQLIDDKIDFAVKILKEEINVAVRLIARRGRLIEVKLRFPRPPVVWREGSYTFPITRVRQPI